MAWVCPSSRRVAALGTAHHPPGCQAHPMSRGRVDGEASAPHEAMGSQGSTTRLPEEGGDGLRPGGPCFPSKQQRHEWKVRPWCVRVVHRITGGLPTLTETGMPVEDLGGMNRRPSDASVCSALAPGPPSCREFRVYPNLLFNDEVCSSIFSTPPSLTY